MVSPTLRTVLVLTAVSFTALWWSPFLTLALIVAVAAVFTVDAVSARAPQLEIEIPTELVRGLEAPFRIVATPAPATTVQCRQPQTAEIRFEPAQGDEQLTGTVLATVRGRHQLEPPVTRTRGPLGLAVRIRRHGEVRRVDVHADLPGARRLAAAVRQGRFRDPGRRQGPLGLGTDFETIREYTPDDDIRRMNWLATERTGVPMVNQHREDTERDLWCLVDTGRLLAAPIGERTRLDLTLDAMAAVAAVADAVGDRTGAVVFDDRVRRIVEPRRASAASLLRSLDASQPSIVDSDHHAAFARVANAKRSLVIVFTDILDGAASAPLLDALPTLSRRHAVLVAGAVDDDLLTAVRTPPATMSALHRADVAAEMLAERDDVRRRLTGAGATVVDVEAAALTSTCVAAYLRLKATARL